jgi:hypothetical protein
MHGGLIDPRLALPLFESGSMICRSRPLFRSGRSEKQNGNKRAPLLLRNIRKRSPDIQNRDRAFCFSLSDCGAYSAVGNTQSSTSLRGKYSPVMGTWRPLAGTYRQKARAQTTRKNRLSELSPFESIIKRKQAQDFADYSRNRNRCRSLQIVSMESLL